MDGAFQSTKEFTSLRTSAHHSLRLFCFPYAGGGTYIFRAWPDGLPKNVEVCVAQLPGRGNRVKERPFTDLMEMIDVIGAAIVPLLDSPFAFFGHSMGAMISFELARYLRRKHRLSPHHLFVSGRRAPQIPMTEAPSYNLPESGFYEKLRLLNGTPTEVLEQPELMELVLPMLRADFSVVETYAYTTDAPLDCPVTAFGGLQDHRVERGMLEAWREQTTSTFTLRMLPGDHFFLNIEQTLLLNLLSKELQQLARTLT